MSPRLSYLAAAFLLSVATFHGEDAAPAATAAVPPYELKNRSKFTNAAENARAPFWPIGWVKRKVGVTAPVDQVSAGPRVQLDGKNFKVTSILLGSGSTPSLAVINGRAYSEGEFLRIPKGGAVPATRIRVQRINDGSVVLQNADQIVVASILRPELSNKKSEELVLDPDR
jgi:hypothetical protein